jgi:hypothetical protein
MIIPRVIEVAMRMPQPPCQANGVFLRKLTLSVVHVRFWWAKSLSCFFLAARAPEFSSYFAQFRLSAFFREGSRRCCGGAPHPPQDKMVVPSCSRERAWAKQRTAAESQRHPRTSQDPAARKTQARAHAIGLQTNHRARPRAPRARRVPLALRARYSKPDQFALGRA